MNPKISRAEAGDAATVAYVVARAFQHLDVCRWLIADDQERGRILPHYFRIVTDHAFTHGTVEVADDLSGVAVWLAAPLPDISGYDAALAAACGLWTPHFQLLDEAMHKAHPDAEATPHDYLAFLAAIPAEKGPGIGPGLLEHHHAVLDAAGRPAYLEASNRQSRRLYERHGYADCAESLNLPYRGERMQPMWRPAAGA